MRNLFFFMLTSLDGYFEAPGQNINWHNVDDEFNEFAIAQLHTIGLLLFGRLTYQLMASYWPSVDARKDDPVVAGLMNSLPKIVFSTTLPGAEWENTRLVRDHAAEEVRRIKQQPGKDMAIFGSSDLAVSLTGAGLIDEYRIMLNPVALGGGKPLLQGLPEQRNFRLAGLRPFNNGNVLLTYTLKPA